MQIRALYGTVALVAIAIITSGIIGFLAKISTNIGVSAFIFISFATAAALSFPLSRRELKLKPEIRRNILGLPLATAVTEIIGWWALLLVIERLPLSLIAPAISTYAIIPTILAIVFLKERLKKIQCLGIPMAIAGVAILASPAASISADHSFDLSSIILIVTVICSWGLWSFLSKLSVPSFGPMRFTYLYCTLTALLATPFLLISPPPFLFTESLVYTIASGICVFLGVFTLFKAMKYIKLSILMPTVSIYPILSFGLGLLFLGESISFVQGFGAGIAVLGVIMVSK